MLRSFAVLHQKLLGTGASMNQKQPMTESEQIIATLAEKERIRLEEQAKSQAEIEAQNKK